MTETKLSHTDKLLMTINAIGRAEIEINKLSGCVALLDKRGVDFPYLFEYNGSFYSQELSQTLFGLQYVGLINGSNSLTPKGIQCVSRVIEESDNNKKMYEQIKSYVSEVWGYDKGKFFEEYFE